MGQECGVQGCSFPSFEGVFVLVVLYLEKGKKYLVQVLDQLIFHVRFRVLHYSTIPVIRVCTCDFHRFCTREVLAFSYKNFPLFRIWFKSCKPFIWGRSKVTLAVLSSCGI